MRMDIRDFSAWATEAKRRMLWRRSEMYGAALLPHQENASVHRAVEELRLQLYELDNEDDIEMVENMAKKRLEEIRNRRRGLK